MPVKRRASKRHDPKSYGTWSAIFDCGYDFFDELPALGVATDAYGKPDREQALEAWQRHGEKWLAEHPHDEPQWAETEFGRPWETDHAR
jgi:hypothetical protein